MWEPWVGSKFEEKRILILGESCYDWIDGNGAEQVCQPNHPILVIHAMRQDPYDATAGTIRKLTRAICNTASPTVEQVRERWDHFAFTNYVPTSVGMGPKRRPKPEDWERAEAEWPALLDIIQPRLILVLGKGLWGYMPETQEQPTSKNIQGYLMQSGVAMCFAVQHPSFGPPWMRFSQWISVLERIKPDEDMSVAVAAFLSV